MNSMVKLHDYQNNFLEKFVNLVTEGKRAARKFLVIIKAKEIHRGETTNE